MKKMIVVTLFLLFVSVFIAGFTSFAVKARGSPEKVDVLIKFEQTPGPSEQALVRSHGGAIKYSYHLVPAIAASVPEKAIEGLSHNPRVKRIELDGEVHFADAELDNTWGVKHIGAGIVHDTGNKGTGVKIAVIDSGIDYTHPELAANYAGGYDFLSDDDDPMDDHGHGTGVAGILAALDNDIGVVGVAPEAKLYALRILGGSASDVSTAGKGNDGGGAYSDVIAALQWVVDNGINLTSNSYAFTKRPGSILEAAYDNSAAAGVLHIAAAGNQGKQGGKNNVIWPARFESVVAVSAIDSNNLLASFSSRGPAIEMTAPGVGLRTTRLGGGYGGFGGTSGATPHVTGTAALIMAAGVTDTNGNGLVNDEIRQILGDTALDLGDAGRDTFYGFGLVYAPAAVGAVP